MEDKTKIKEVNCPHCTAVMKYDMDKGVLLCPYCGSEEKITFAGSDLKVTEEMSRRDVYRYHGIEGIPITEDALDEKAFDWGQKMVQASCKDCGGEIVFPEGSMTATCPYCDSTFLDITNTTQKPPTAIVLFKYKKEGFRESMATPIFDNILCPKAFKKSINFDDFTSMYVPVWVIDAAVEINYHAQYEKQVEDGTLKKVFNGVEVAASNVYKLLMDDQKENYDIELHAEYKPELVSGCVVQKYTVTLKEAYETAKVKIQEKAYEDLRWKLRRTMEADEEEDIKLEFKTINFSDSKYRLILVPVYFHSISYEGKIYPQSINGQNGKYVGDFPAKFRKQAMYKMYV